MPTDHRAIAMKKIEVPTLGLVFEATVVGLHQLLCALCDGFKMKLLVIRAANHSTNVDLPSWPILATVLGRWRPSGSEALQEIGAIATQKVVASERVKGRHGVEDDMK